MANRSDGPFGFKPYGTILRKQLYRVAAAATVMFKYDLVRLAAAGDVDAAIAGVRVKVLGPILACFDNDMVPTTYIADSGSGYVLVADDPNQLLVAQEDANAATIGLADRGLNINIISTHRGNTGTGISKMELDSNTKAASRELQMRIVDIYENDKLLGGYRRWVCLANWHNLMTHASGV